MEPNGITKGTLPPMSVPTPTPVPVAAPVPVSAPPPATVPVLPDNLNAMIPLGAVIHRMTNDAFAELSNLSETLPSMSDTDRKIELLKYTLSKREQFIKLLVLTKWGKNAQKFQQCQNIVGFLQHENELFTRAVGGLFETYKMFGRARVRNFDIPTAIDVLTTGSYQRLPSRIKQAYVEDDKPTSTEIAATLEKLDDVIRMRLLCDELVPPAMKYTVGKGKVKFVVANEFEVTLTVSGPGSPKDVPWRIVSLKILAKPVGGSFQGLETSLNEGQMRAIIMIAQKELESVTSANLTHHPALPAPESTPLPANQALLRLYDYLHTLSLHLLIELVYTQAYQLSRSGWTDKLRLDMNQNRTLVRLVYWNNGFAPQAAQQQPLVPPPKRRASTTTAGQGKDANQTLASQQEHYLEIRIEERQGLTEPIPEGLAGALVDPKLLGYPKAYIKVVWSQVAKGIVPESAVASILELDPSQLHVERLLLKAVNMHTGQVMQGFYDRLWLYIESIKDKRETMEGTHFSKDDVKLEALDSGEQQQSAVGTAGLPGPRALLVRLKGDRWIRIRIDIRTGRVVVREVGKTAEGDDSIIAAFQARLNENADNIVDALISLRFSMTIVELESIGIVLGLQPYRRLALGKQDAAQFGANIQQILFLQYPQHPRHYLVVGVIEQKFRVWLIEVAPTDREIAGIWLTLKSFEPVYLQGLKRRRREIEEGSAYSATLSKRKSVQFDLDNDGASDSPPVEEMTIDQDVMTKLEALCRVRICLNETKNQLQELGIQYRPVAHSSKDGDSSASGQNMFPILRLDQNSISSGAADDMFEFVGAKLTGWWDSQRETCNFEVKAKFVPNITPPNMESGALDSCVHYHAESRMLTFTYKTRGTFVRQFQQDWETIIRMLKIIRQLHAPTLTNPHIRLKLCHLHQVQLQYFDRYIVSIRWAPAATSDKRSSLGVVVPRAPRFQQGLYEIDLPEILSEKGLRHVNPHRRMKSFLQDMFNREADLHSLMNTMVQTCSVLEVLDRLENSVKEDSMGVKMLSIVPRAVHHFRVIYGSRYALDIRAFDRTHLSMHDASFPNESYGSSLPPPPAPALAPLLLTPGRLISPTTKGHLHYVPINNFQAIVDGIDVDKEDEEFNNLQRAIETGANEESYDVMPLPNGVLCSRTASGRVLYRIAKLMESLV
ncbi:mediator complex subunit [Linnemannia zychae]|nr:mediator complex subunit [Linnemannia zychae]